MRALDFIIYYTARYFAKNSYLLTWSTAVERACYATSLATIFWAFTVWEIVNDYILRRTNDLSKVPILIIGFGALFFYQYLYINKERYALIDSDSYRKFQLKEETGILIVIIFNIISFIVPFALAIFTGITRK